MRYILGTDSCSNEERVKRCKQFLKFREFKEKAYFLKLQEDLDKGVISPAELKKKLPIVIKNGRIPAAFLNEDEKELYQDLYGNKAVSSVKNMRKMRSWHYSYSLADLLDKFCDPFFSNEYIDLYDILCHGTHVSSMIQACFQKGFTDFKMGRKNTIEFSSLILLYMEKVYVSTLFSSTKHTESFNSLHNLSALNIKMQRYI